MKCENKHTRNTLLWCIFWHFQMGDWQTDFGLWRWPAIAGSQMSVESHGMEDSRTAHFWYFAPISVLAWDNILILTPTILDLIMKKAAGRRGWWWKPFAWLYGCRHAKFLWAIIFCSNVFANDFFQTALRFLSLEIWLVKIRNTELFTKEIWGLQLFTEESTRL